MQNKQYCIFGLLIVFFIFLIIVERKSSIKIILKLVLTIVTLYLIYIKGILNNINLGVLSILVVFLISFINIFIKEGFHKKSFAELISVLITSFFSGILILLICFITKTKISYQDSELNANEIEFSIFMIVIVGVFMDVISRMIFKLDIEKDKSEDVSWIKQFKYGLDIGKELIFEKINMLFLIFAGITLFPISVYVSKGYDLIQILNVDNMFFSCLVLIIGNIGLVLSVPITSIVYSIFNRKKTIYKTVSENKIDGKRSLKL